MQKITTFLWFDDKAEEAANFYTSIFKNSKIGIITRYREAAANASGRPAGSVMTVVFQFNGQEFIALNGGPLFQFTESVSLVVNCETQAEIDGFWKSFPQVARRANAAGSKTNMACRGKLFRQR
jgi:predicted 3-demethylubiquinone-9 3-methyltransferase (glyoxalase superfamily)